MMYKGFQEVARWGAVYTPPSTIVGDRYGIGFNNRCHRGPLDQPRGVW